MSCDFIELAVYTTMGQLLLKLAATKIDHERARIELVEECERNKLVCSIGAN